MGQNLLKNQLEEQRFLHGVAYVQSAANGLKKITTSELAHLNQILTGDTADPWRFEAASIRIPSGSTLQFNVLSNPVHIARDVLGTAQQMAGNQDFADAAFHAYSQLVLSHLFRDANRRTAVLAVLWLLWAQGATVDARELGRIAIGDLRTRVDLEQLKSQLDALLIRT